MIDPGARAKNVTTAPDHGGDARAWRIAVWHVAAPEGALMCHPFKPPQTT